MLYVLGGVQIFVLLVWFVVLRPPDAAVWPIFTPPLFVPIAFALNWLCSAVFLGLVKLLSVVFFGLVKLLDRQRD
jgi:hypothetical protein